MNQTLQEITFIFGPPESVSENNSYDKFLEVSKSKKLTFCEVYKDYLEHSIKDNALFESILREVLDKDLSFKKYFFSFMTTSSNDNQYKKFFTENNKHVNIPTLTIYPNEITYSDGRALDFDFNDEYVEICSGLLANLFRLDWIRNFYV